MNAKKLIFSFLFFVFSIGIFSQSTNISGQINDFAKVIDIRTENNRSILVLDSDDDFAACSRALLIQMKGADINTIDTEDFGQITNINEAGNYEIVEISEVGNNEIFLTGILENTYSIFQRIQIVTLPTFQNATVTNELITKDWDGITGGIIALEVEETLELNADISVQGAGFRGGLQSDISYTLSGGAHCSRKNFRGSGGIGEGGAKGEGISGEISGTDSGRGAYANGGGGGNSHNAGGGGGGNGGSGGMGGNEWIGCSSIENGGRGGRELSYNSKVSAFFGGGGGSGEANGLLGTSGENGGGIILIIANKVIGNGNLISAKGDDVIENATADGAGGGGAGGTVLLKVETFETSLEIDVTGGAGGNNVNPGSCVAPGGGGGGGIIWFSGAAQPANVNNFIFGGDARVYTNSSNSSCHNTTYGATLGKDGKVFFNLDPGAISPQGASLSGIELDIFICINDAVLLQSSTQGADEYFWNNGSITSEITVGEAGNYWVDILKDGCLITDSFYVSLVDPRLDLGNDITICEEDEVSFSALIEGAISYVWSNGAETPAITVSNEGIYQVAVETVCGELTDSIELLVTPCFCDIEIPNIFSPNNDGVNDVFAPIYDGCLNAELNMKIYNRWGQKVAEFSGLDQFWDGNFKGKPAVSDVYVWKLEFTDSRGVSLPDQGDVTLYR